jgi:hypothetical protein
MDRSKLILRWLDMIRTMHSLILMSAIGCDSFVSGGKALNIRYAADDR